MTLADDRRIADEATPIAVSGFGRANAAFIAHFNPAYVSKLLDVVEAARGIDWEGVRGDIWSTHGEFCISSDNCDCDKRAEQVGQFAEILSALEEGGE